MSLDEVDRRIGWGNGLSASRPKVVVTHLAFHPTRDAAPTARADGHRAELLENPFTRVVVLGDGLRGERLPRAAAYGGRRGACG